MTPSALNVLAGNATWSCEAGEAAAWLRTLPSNSVHCCVTSPPYWGLRDYGVAEQLGLEPTPGEFVERLVGIFRELRRVLHPSGTVWLNLGDSYATGAGSARSAGGKSFGKSNPVVDARAFPASQPNRAPQFGLKPKDRCMIPARVAIALQADGWWLRDEIVWQKPAPMPLSVSDRTSPAHEMIYLLTKAKRYFFDNVAIFEPAVSAGRPMVRTGGWAEGKGKKHHATVQNGRGGGRDTGEAVPATRNKRSVWKVSGARFKGAHFATFPAKLVEPCVLAGTSDKGVCPRCWFPWVRQVRKTRVPTRPGVDTKCLPHSDGDTRTAKTKGWSKPLVIGNRDPKRHVTQVETVGWKAGCACPAADPMPAVVLDLFAGSGTTLAEAVRLGRRAVGCELNPAYIADHVVPRMAAIGGP
jgi:DNA modification methylase